MRLFEVHYTFTNPDIKQVIANSMLVQAEYSSEVKSLFLNSRAFKSLYEVIKIKEIARDI